MRTMTIIISAILLSTGLAFAAIIHVPADQPTIQDGVDNSSAGDTVLIARGVYPGHVIIENHPVTLASEYIFSQNPLDRDSTIISNNLDWPGITILLASGRGTNIIGLTIRKCVFYAISLGDSTTVSYNAIDSCWAWNAEEGCAIVAARNDSYIGYFSISGNIIRQNSGMAGTVIYALHNSGEICNNIIYDNQSAAPEYGILARDCRNIEIYNNTICYNYTTNSLAHGVIYSENRIDILHVYNNIIAFNDAGIGRDGSGIFTYEYNDVFQNTHGDYYNFPAGETDISSDPLFVGGTPFSYELSWGSPCIDAAKPSTARDPDASNPEIGAIYFDRCQGPYFRPGDINSDGAANGLDIVYSVEYCKFGHRPILTCACVNGAPLQLAGDVNGNCAFNGIDISFFVNFLKGGAVLRYCDGCPPVE